MASGFVSALGGERQPTIRVALMDFAVDDNSYISAQTAAAFTSLLQIEVANERGFEWVERAQLDRAKKELRLSEMELLSGTADVRRGKWVKADWLVTGRFLLDDESRRLLFVEITDLHHADVLASETVRLNGMAATPMNLASDQVPIASAALRRLFSEARKRADETAGKLVIAPLFFVDLRSYGPKEAFESLRSAFDDCLEQLTGTNSRFRLIRFPKAYRAMDEAEMLVDGLVEWDSKSWESPADLYVWGSYSMYSPFTVAITNGVRYEKHRTQQQLSFVVWDGVSPPLPVNFERVIAKVEDLGAKEAAPFWERLSKAIQERASTQKLHVATGDVRRELADSLMKPFLRASGLVESTRLIETAWLLRPR
jgi:hypothetical protein